MKSLLLLLSFFLGRAALFGSDVALSVIVTPDPYGRWITMEPQVSVRWSESESLVLSYWSATNAIEAVLELRCPDGTLQEEDVWTGPRPSIERTEVATNQTKSYLGFGKHYSGLKAGRYSAKVSVIGNTKTRDRVVLESAPIVVNIGDQSWPNKTPHPTPL
jgi:hypothetical protein